MAFLRSLSAADLQAFGELIDRLDADPFSHSTALLLPGKVALRRATFGPHIMIFAFDPSQAPNGGFMVAACETIARP